ncbi:hypothetical protein HJG60_001724 [Phyllostomus discolor]|uniref:DUF5577 domain-containing protein n=1 Tax=Phyllostomus discolor TaxID=89673 RepID=A0A833YJG1_9CHIR|nr:hypothetical protein HJG60_001724 [Phyllostomus discolor]
MVSVTMATSEWIQFFKEAGIPPGPAVNYAVMFVDNRIQKSMLLDLNKEIMNELGVTVVGDIIAILKHAKVVHRQDVCKAATESVPCSPSPLPGEMRRSASSAASRMIANSLNRDSPPGTPPRRPDTSTSKISVTVSNKMAAKSAKAAAALAHREEESLTVPTKRRRVTAEMEGKYIINMPKGTTPRTRKILEQQQAAKGVHRTSVFDRLGAETKADTTTGNKVSWRQGAARGSRSLVLPRCCSWPSPHRTPAHPGATSPTCPASVPFSALVASLAISCPDLSLGAAPGPGQLLGAVLGLLPPPRPTSASASSPKQLLSGSGSGAPHCPHSGQSPG